MAREGGRLSTTGRRADGRDYNPELLVPSKTGNRQLMAGLFVLVGLIAVILALFALTDPGTFRGRYVLYSVVGNAGGIRKGDPVQLRGVNIGRVKGFKIGGGGVTVALELDKGFRIPADSRMELTSSGLLGGMTATILPGQSANPMQPGDTVAGATAAGPMDVAAALGQRADTILASAQAMLSPATVSGVSESATELRGLLLQTGAMVAEDRANIRALTANLRTTSAELAAGHTGQQIAMAAARLDSLSGQLSATSARLNAATASLQVVLARMEHGEGTLGRLSADPSLYDNLNTAAQNFSALAQDIRANPKKYINVKVF